MQKTSAARLEVLAYQRHWKDSPLHLHLNAFLVDPPLCEDSQSRDS